MKILTGTTLALAFSVASVCSVLTAPALSQTNSMMVRGQVTGQIESIDGSTVMVRTSDGTVGMYEIDPEVISSLKLSKGSTVLLNSRNLMSGVITRIGPQNVLVRLDNGETEYFIVTQEARGVLSPGERVVITPDQRITSAEDYIFTAKDITLVQPIATTTTGVTSTVSGTRTEVETSTTTTEVTPPPVSSTTTVQETTVQETQPVRALW